MLCKGPDTEQSLGCLVGLGTYHKCRVDELLSYLMILSVSLFCYNPTMSMASSRQKRSKPRGIWKAQRVIPPRLPAREFGPKLPPRSASDSDSDRASNYSTTSTASKRKPRRQSPLENTSKERTPYSDYSRRSSPDPNRVDSWVTRTKIMDTSTTAGRGLQRQQETFDHEDWEDLKELFAKTAEQYESAFSLVEVDRLS